MRAEFRGERLERMLQPAPIEDSIPNRAIEDAVADLLRPLLRTWLAENMPKIVERALRREMTERLLPGQKRSLRLSVFPSLELRSKAGHHPLCIFFTNFFLRVAFATRLPRLRRKPYLLREW